MDGFKDNYFTNDSYHTRTERLKMLKNYIDYWSMPLSIPKPLLEWARLAYDRWNGVLKTASAKKDRSEDLYQELRDADEILFRYYLKCKRLLVNSRKDDPALLKAFGVAGRFTRRRETKIAFVEKMIRNYQNHLQNTGETVIPKDFIEKLLKLFNKAQQIHDQIIELKKKNSQPIKTPQANIFLEDSRKLRTLYSWALMTWEADNAYLYQLGFAVVSKNKADSADDDLET
jgi:hypothetical protein